MEKKKQILYGKEKTNIAWIRKNKYCMDKKKQILHG